MIAETRLRVAQGVVAVLGLGVAGYLVYERARGDSPVCVVGGGCTTVQKSEYSELAGIPVAVLGLLAYFALLTAAFMPGPLGRAVGLFTAVVSFGFSAWLTYAELFIIEAVCAWCVTSAILVTISLVIAVARAVAGSRSERGGAGTSGRSGPDPRSPDPSRSATPG
ncbi:MAG: vitamin K epoxide reductase family protein [Thermoleophilia bacterium]